MLSTRSAILRYYDNVKRYIFVSKQKQATSNHVDDDHVYECGVIDYEADVDSDPDELILTNGSDSTHPCDQCEIKLTSSSSRPNVNENNNNNNNIENNVKKRKVRRRSQTKRKSYNRDLITSHEHDDFVLGVQDLSTRRKSRKQSEDTREHGLKKYSTGYSYEIIMQSDWRRECLRKLKSNNAIVNSNLSKLPTMHTCLCCFDKPSSYFNRKQSRYFNRKQSRHFQENQSTHSVEEKKIVYTPEFVGPKEDVMLCLNCLKISPSNKSKIIVGKACVTDGTLKKIDRKTINRNTNSLLCMKHNLLLDDFVHLM